jgi:hypothetical protein
MFEYGKPLPAPSAQEVVRFLSHVKHKGNCSPCWQWNGTRNHKGYGGFWYRKCKVLAHRFAYTFARGTIPVGTTIHHTCFNPSCVNPEHLEILDLSENSALKAPARGAA